MCKDKKKLPAKTPGHMIEDLKDQPPIVHRDFDPDDTPPGETILDTLRKNSNPCREVGAEQAEPPFDLYGCKPLFSDEKQPEKKGSKRLYDDIDKKD